MDIDEIDALLNRRSGLKGMTGQNDMRAVRQMAADGDERAVLALAVYTHRLRKYVGAYAAVLGGLDVIAFTAGVGENSAETRAEVLRPLAFLGVELDEAANAERGDGIRRLTTEGSAVTALVVPTNEELEIARLAIDLARD
jgi:acetate kinase